MTHFDQQVYPRPDFKRPDLAWLSLNGPWDFIFDDLNVGIKNTWYLTGLPEQVDASRTSGSKTAQIASQKTTITVPFPFQTPVSGVNSHDAHEFLWYERKISDIRTPEQVNYGHRLLLRFGAVDYEAQVWLNGQSVGNHRGGHVPFTIDVTDSLSTPSTKNRLTIRVRDSPYDLTQPRGKQYWKPQSESIFYTPSSGIWQSVWLESVPATHIADSSDGTILRSNDVNSGVLYSNIRLCGQQTRKGLKLEMTSYVDEIKVATVQQSVPENASSIDVELPMWLSQSQIDSVVDDHQTTSNSLAWRALDNNRYLGLWSPEYPFLYEIDIKLLDPFGAVLDEVRTIAGMRSLSWNHGDNTFRLNDKPYFQALVLDQGYWPDSNITPPSSDALRRDIELSKAMGFNGCRKHQKVEDPYFLYWADRLGYLVWGEMANAFEFSDTYVERFNEEWEEVVRRNINHPCVVTWTPVNESWGYNDLQKNRDQREHLRTLYRKTRELDPTRPVNDNDGWEHVSTDLTTFHEYADATALKDICSDRNGVLFRPDGRPTFVLPIDGDTGGQYSATAPIICTEFGGVNIAPSQGNKGSDKDWGYTTASDSAELLKRIKSLVMAVVEGGLCCGFVYTQLTDIEQEVNGLYTFDRRPKLDVDEVKGIMDRARSKYFELLEQKRMITEALYIGKDHD